VNELEIPQGELVGEQLPRIGTVHVLDADRGDGPVDYRVMPVRQLGKLINGNHCCLSNVKCKPTVCNYIHVCHGQHPPPVVSVRIIKNM
jgi:hypothetical protein